MTPSFRCEKCKAYLTDETLKVWRLFHLCAQCHGQPKAILESWARAVVYGRTVRPPPVTKERR
jgi:Zn finger protein HypA/HybF involved in hydrogenase expression